MPVAARFQSVREWDASARYRESGDILRNAVLAVSAGLTRPTTGLLPSSGGGPPSRRRTDCPWLLREQQTSSGIFDDC